MSHKKLGFGLMRLPQLGEGFAAPVDIEQVKQMVDTFIERGFTYFDTALMYVGAQSESAAKECLVDRHPRDSFTLATKLHSGFFHTVEERDNVFAGQLAKCGVAYFDYYLLHDINSHSIGKFTELGCFEWMIGLKEKGLAKHIGFSLHDGPELLDEVLTAHPEMEFVQLQLNYLDWEDSGVQSRLCYETTQKYNKPVLVMEPVKGGSLANVRGDIRRMFKEANANMSVASWAIRFAASLESVVTVLSGMSCEEQVNDNLSYMESFEKFSDKEIEMVLKAAEMIRSDVLVPCTACRYCVPECPMGIEIPEYFKAYNMIKTENRDAAKGEFAKIAEKGSKPSDCVKCGACEAVCPQKIKIRDFLCDVTEELGE